jgi:chemotaxis protein MotA
MLKSIPKHFQILLNTKRFNPNDCIDQLVELAQIARKNGLLSLEEKANEQTDPFFKQAIMLIVDANDPDKVRSILENDIECMSARHEDAAAMYDKASSIAPAFGMVGTLVGLINMLKSMNVEEGAGDLGSSMSTALVTTLYGCVLAHMIFGPIATNLRTRDEEEVLCKQIIVEGIMSIQSGENPKFLRERLETYMGQKQRGGGSGGEGGEGGEAKGGKGKKGKKE